MRSRIALLTVLASAPMIARAEIGSADLRFDAGEAIALLLQDEPSPLPDAPAPGFGYESDRWWASVGGGAGVLVRRADAHLNAFASASRFIVDDIEVGVEGGGWWFLQEGDDAGGLNATLIFRWHLKTEPERKDWTLFMDIGIGMLVSNEPVPEEGSRFNFTPRAGLGLTTRLGEGENRLLMGVRWQHISNARLFGGDDNPGRDPVMFYAGVIFPF